MTRLESYLVGNIHLGSLSEILKKVSYPKPWRNTWILAKKKFRSSRDRLALQLSKCLEETSIPEWMMKRKSYPDPEGTSHKVTIPSNYWLIMCLPMSRKILKAWIKEEIYDSLECLKLFLEEQKGYRKGTRTGELQYI